MRSWTALRHAQLKVAAPVPRQHRAPDPRRSSTPVGNRHRRHRWNAPRRAFPPTGCEALRTDV